MLPAATAPNAIVKEAAGISTFDMMRAGLVMNCLCVASTVGAIWAYGGLVFDFSGLPAWLTDNDVDYAACAANATAGR